MIGFGLKRFYFSLFRFPMRANALRHRLFQSKKSGQKVHLGPGQGNYLNGWINVDANFLTAKMDIWANIADRLPFGAGTIDAFYSHHVIEHLPDSRLGGHFSDMFRCLKPGGVIRVGGPNGDSAISKFLANDKTWFSDFPDRRQSIGGKFANFILCRGEHLSILTASYLTELAVTAGFAEISVCQPLTFTNYPGIFDKQVLGKESESDPECPHTLLIEARKPGLAP